MPTVKDFVRLKITGAREAAESFGKMPDVLRDDLATTVTGVIDDIRTIAIARASGGVLKIKSGKYSSAITSAVKTNKTGIRGQVNVKDPRSFLFEFGGHTKPHEIPVSSVKALHFLRGSSEVFAGSVHHPGGDYGREQLPGAGGGSVGRYSVLFRTFREKRADVYAQLAAAVGDSVNK